MPRPSPLSSVLLRSALFLGLAFGAVAARAQESVYHGVFTTSNLDSSLSSLTAFEVAAGKPVAIVNVFQGIDKTGNVFPTTDLQRIRNHGSIPLLSLEPWLDLDEVATGKHDALLSKWALGAKAWGHPFFLRYAHEMNTSWYPWAVWATDKNNTAAKYVAAWRHVHELFTALGVSNITWVWCVNRFYDDRSARVSELYPGDHYVDWISFDAYNRGTGDGTGWREFRDASAETYDEILRIAPGKPVMVAECGTTDSGGDKAAWFRSALKNHLKTRFPRIKAWVYFNLNKSGWDNRITSTEAARAAYAESVALSYYSANKYSALSTSPIPPLLNDAQTTDTEAPFVRFALPATARVSAGATTDVRIEATDKNGVARVDFFLNGALQGTKTTPPYQFQWAVPEGDGNHTLKAIAYDPAGNSAATTHTITAVTPSVYWGAFTTSAPGPDLQSVLDFEADAEKTVSIVHVFVRWADSSPAFPATIMQRIRDHGSMPLATWEPWNPGDGAIQPGFTLRSIADGAHDAYLSEWALAAKAWGRPFFLRFAQQMNGDWFPWSAGVNGNTAADYVAAWRHVHELFTSLEVANVTWVWSVNRLYGGASNNIAALYPGDRYVDWVAMDGYNRGGSAWRDFTTTFDGTYQQLLALAPGKPVMVAETGSVENGGDKAAWFRDALQIRLPSAYPRIKAVVHCEAAKDGYQNTIASSGAARAAFAESIGLPDYTAATFGSITASPILPLVTDALATDTQPPFVTFSRPLTGRVLAGRTNEIRVEFADKSALDRIEIRIDGVLRQTERLAPYQFFWDVPATTGTSYTITATAYDAAGRSAVATHSVVGVAPPHPVDAWKATRFTPAELAAPDISADTADPDADGLPNLVEYALDTDPHSPGAGPALTRSTSGAARLQLSFNRIASAAIRYEVQASDDLVAWTTFWSSSGAQNVVGAVTVADSTDLVAQPRRFLRLRVSRE